MPDNFSEQLKPQEILQHATDVRNAEIDLMEPDNIDTLEGEITPETVSEALKWKNISSDHKKVGQMELLVATGYDIEYVVMQNRLYDFIEHTFILKDWFAHSIEIKDILHMTKKAEEGGGDYHVALGKGAPQIIKDYNPSGIIDLREFVQYIRVKENNKVLVKKLLMKKN